MFENLSISLSSIVLGLVVLGMVAMAYWLGRISMRRELETLNAPPGEETTKRVWWANWFQGVSTEMVGAVITTILLGTVVGLAQEASLEEQQREELVLQMASQSNDFAVEAARILGSKGWLEDGTTHGINLREAHLDGANLGGADLAEANLDHARLERSNLAGADLENADFDRAELTDANLDQANLTGATHLTIEQLQSVGTLQGATLPDGTQLSDDADWETEFETWISSIALDEDGYIIPDEASLSDHEDDQ